MSGTSSEAPSLVLVLGVHRSGTSLLTRALVAAGAAAGGFEDTRDADNPGGYAEHPRVRDLNDRLLAHLGASWDNWGFRASCVDFDAPGLAPWRREAAELLRGIFPGAGPFVLKDPRISTLAPFWEKVVPEAGFDLRRILILRDPAEVAESQRQRVARRPHEFPVIAEAEPMAALWAVTMAEILAAMAGPAHVVGHAALLADPGTVLRAAADFAGLSPEAAARFAGEEVQPSLHRARVSPGEAETGVWMAAAQALFAALRDLPPPGVLTPAEARGLLGERTDLELLLRGLSAVRPSIRRMREVQEARQAGLAGLGAFIWALAPLARHAPPAELEGFLDQATKIARDHPALAPGHLVFGHAVARLHLAAGRGEEALRLLEELRPHFGQNPAFQSLERKIREAGTPDGGAPG